MINAQLSSLRDLLRNNVLQIRFIKSDGTERVLKGTLMKEYLPYIETLGDIKEDKESTIEHGANTTCVWDVENKGFRSFRNDSIIEYTVIKGEKYV
jgi:hypothetical protein